MFEPEPLVVEPPGDVTALTALAAQAAAHWGLPEPVLARVGQNAVFAAGDVVVRVGVATAPMEVALAFAERLATIGVRATRPARPDVVRSGRLSATAWERIDFHPEARIDWERVGAMVARVHELDPATVDHPLPYCADFPWWRFDDLIGEIGAVDDGARTGLERCLAEHGWWIETCRAAPLAVCHGDVHPGNVLVDDGGPVLIDWDLLCVGPREWDHAALWTWTERWGGEPGVYESFAVGYARAVDAQLVGAIAEMRLLAATLMRLRRGRTDPAAAAEAQRRLAYWRGDSNPPIWRPQ